MSNITVVNKLINCFSKLPGVGHKTAERFAYSLITGNIEDAEQFSSSILEAKKNVRFCSNCGTFTDKETCDICTKRSGLGTVCVVSYPRDVIAIEKSGAFKGTYHVLHGVLNPLEGKGPNDLNLKTLLTRVREEQIKEVIIATNPDVEGEATASYISHLLKPLSIKVTRLAQGLSLGTNIEFADEVTLLKAIKGRIEI